MIEAPPAVPLVDRLSHDVLLPFAAPPQPPLPLDLLLQHSATQRSRQHQCKLQGRAVFASRHATAIWSLRLNKWLKHKVATEGWTKQRSSKAKSAMRLGIITSRETGRIPAAPTSWLARCQSLLFLRSALYCRAQMHTLYPHNHRTLYIYVHMHTCMGPKIPSTSSELSASS